MSTSRPVRGIVVALVLVSVVVLATTLYLYSPGPLSSTKVAIYTDNGIRASSRIALNSMFQWMGAETTIIGPEEVENGDLELYDILVMPGGCWCDERCDILDEKMELVREYVENGGAYFGIDGGASYATGYRLNLFNGTLYPDACGADDFLIDINVNCESTGPDLSTEPDTYRLFYEASGYFNSSDMSNIITIGSYVDNDLPCMIAFTYGTGTVFLSSPHPEYEEGDERDGTDLWESTELDPDSEWDLMLKVCQWLLE